MKIEVKNVYKKFKKIEVLKNISLEFIDGNIYGFVGRNGSGKSVFLKLLCGFYEASDGQICYDGVDLKKSGLFPPSTRSLIEKPNFLPYLTGFENLKLLANIQKRISDDDIINILEKVNLQNDMNKKYCEYSLGMKQKLGIAQVLMEDPHVMILDEPFNGIEDETAKKIREILLEEKRKNKIIIIASHIKEDIETLADIVYKFGDGKIQKIKVSKNG